MRFPISWFRTVAIVWALIISFPAANSATTEFFVAPGGNDSNPGDVAKPFATLEAARDAIRSIKARGSLPTGGVTVWIQGGDYVRTKQFELLAEDSGTGSSPIVYRGAEHKSVRLLGGRILTNFVPVTEASILSRLSPPARAKVRQVDLRALGINGFGDIQSRGFGRTITPAHSELFYNHQALTLARWPNEGEWERIVGIPEGAGQRDEHGGTLGDLPFGFYYSGERPRNWADPDHVWVHGYWAWDWANSYERIASLDPDKHWVKTAAPYGLYGFRKGQRFYFLNILEELDEPGEWFLDRNSERLYFWPPENGAGTNSAPASGELMLSLLGTPLLVANGASDVTFRGLQLEGSRSHGISIRGGTNVLVAGCAIRLMGNYGVWIEGGRGHRVVSCDIESTGDGGVNLVGGDRQTLEPSNDVVENCHFEKQGRWSKCYVPAVLVTGVGMRVVHNLIHDHPHCGILFGGNDHQIEYNEIHHVAQETGDVGAIYEGRDWTFRGNAIRYNYIHETGGVGMGSMGVYMDDCVSGTEISGNIFFKVTRAAFLGGGRDHQVVNNIFVDCQPAVQLDGRGLDKTPVWHNMVYDYMKQQLEAVPRQLYLSRYPKLEGVNRSYQQNTNGIPPAGNTVAQNISVGGQWLSVGWHASKDMMDLHDNYEGDPGFVAPWQRDFRLRPNSSVLAKGFKQIPQEQIGLQDDAFRHSGVIEALE